jgi:hypothetical protein
MKAYTYRRQRLDRMKTYDFGQKTKRWDIKSGITSIPEKYSNGNPIKFVIWKKDDKLHYEGYTFDGKWIKRYES